MNTPINSPWRIAPGEIRLKVSNLPRALDFYTRILGLQVLTQAEGSASLGVANKPLVSLVEIPGARRVLHTSGLYHFALLLPSRRNLAEALLRLENARYAVQGFADHLVSEAVYLSDPDGNGIEIYADRPQEAWRDERGNLRIGTLPLDLDSLLAELNGAGGKPPASIPERTRMGHLHLHVAHLRQAVEFYTQILGFDVMMYYGDRAVFLSVDGYHHHIGLNTWAGEGVPPPPNDSVGMEYGTLLYSQANQLETALERSQHAGVNVSSHNGAYYLEDPSRNRLRIAINE